MGHGETCDLVNSEFGKKTTILPSLFYLHNYTLHQNEIFHKSLPSTTVVRKGWGLNAIFDSQTEKFLSQRVQSKNSTETELC